MAHQCQQRFVEQDVRQVVEVHRAVELFRQGVFGVNFHGRACGGHVKVGLCPIQNSALVPKYLASRRAVSGVTARRSRTTSLMRGAGTCKAIAKAWALIAIGRNNSSRKISPG